MVGKPVRNEIAQCKLIISASDHLYLEQESTDLIY